MIISFFEKWT